jgi:hypothetical protein
VNGAFGSIAIFLLFVVVGVTVSLLIWRHHQRTRADLDRLAQRDGLTITEAPLGFTADQLAGRFVATPRGDARYGLEFAVESTLAVSLDGTDRDLVCAAFRWWSVEEQTTHDADGETASSYVKVDSSVAIVRLPVDVRDRIVVRPESLVGRMALSRSDHQVESDEFNRRFRVEGDDRRLVVQLLDASAQHALLESFRGRSIELTGDLLVLGGDPSGREPGLAGFVGELPVLRDDLRRLLGVIPPAFWRAVGLADPGRT